MSTTQPETYQVYSPAPGENHPTVARFILSGRPPRLTEALSLAERAHAALVELSDGSSVFTGCDDSKMPLKGHTHAFIFSESNQASGRGQNGEITHLTIYAPAGFDQRDRSALEGLWEIRGSGIQVALVLQGVGRPEDFGGANVVRGQSPLLAESRTWVSRTPFVSTRHPKVTRAGVPKRDESGLQIGSPEHELRRLLRLSGYPEPVAAKPVSVTALGGREVPWQEFCCRRTSGQGRRSAYDRGYGFRIEFPEAVRGPVAVGYGVHFGMGGFEALSDSAKQL
ncbi:MAG: type I-U CRISPR-associated protein Cas5/Cas6 [Methanotrichaceae archaeon]|nr:type I-U CRISPR-associated protein Cas5/Cas6 [Methanotrichaceae archaeon]